MIKRQDFLCDDASGCTNTQYDYARAYRSDATNPEWRSLCGEAYQHIDRCDKDHMHQVGHVTNIAYGAYQIVLFGMYNRSIFAVQRIANDVKT